MPLINEQEIDFDSMSDAELEDFLKQLTEESNKRRPRLEARLKSPKEPKKKDYIRVEI